MRDTLSAATVEISNETDLYPLDVWWQDERGGIGQISVWPSGDGVNSHVRFEGSHADVQSFLRVAVPLSRS